MENPSLSEPVTAFVESNIGTIAAMHPLNEGMRNRTFFVKTTTGQYVVKTHPALFDDRGFSKYRNEVLSLERLASLDVSPRIVAADEAVLSIISRYVPGPSVEKRYRERRDESAIEKAISIITKAHHCHSPHPLLFRRSPVELYEAIALCRKHTKDTGVTDAIEDYARCIISILSGEAEQFILGDTFASNFIVGDKTYFVDAELCSRGPVAIDLCQIMTDLSLDATEKRGLLHQYNRLTGRPVSFAAFDAATVYLNTFLLGIYARELETGMIEKGKRSRMEQRVYSTRRDLAQLTSREKFATAIKGAL